jgi:AcrR family transcriptional regulator
VRRAQIVDAADVVLASHDPVDVTFEQVAQVAGVSRALVYNYFRDKSTLLAELYLRNFAELTQAIAVAVGSADRALEDRLRSVVGAYVRFAGAHPSTRKLLGHAEAMEHPAVRCARRDHAETIASLWGGTDEARIVACGLVGFLEAAVLEWVDESGLGADQAIEVIHAQLWWGFDDQADGTTVSAARQQYHATTLR